MAFLDKILGKDEKDEREVNLKQEIKSLEFRKESVLASINKEIANLQSAQNTLFLEAGKYAYDTWCNDKKQADLISYWNQVQELSDKIAGQEAKREEMTGRYDEEINLISSNLSIDVAVNSGDSPEASGSAVCPNCGFVIADGDLFCQGCGTKLS